MRLANENHIVMVDDNVGDTHLARICCEASDVTNPWLSFSNGPEFLNHLAKVKRGEQPMPALVLLDLNMPGMSGLTVLERTRVDPFFQQLPIFCILTSSSDPKDKNEAEALGATGFVTKPDDIRDYEAFFNSLLGP